MPYKVRKEGKSWVVRKQRGGKLMGRHSSKTKAFKQIRAIYANQKGRRSE